MKYYNFSDKNHKCCLDQLFRIVTLIKDYCDRNNLEDVEVLSIEDNTATDTVNQRFDIEIMFRRKGIPVYQKLLILKGEVIDGKTFHKRYEEFYVA